MTAAIDIFLILHFIGLAAIIGSWMTVLRAPRVIPGMLHGAILQVVSGLALVGLNEANDATLNHTKVAVKLVIAVVILVLAVVGLRQQKATVASESGVAVATSTVTLAQAIGILAVANVIIAVVW
ncbi:hypothetical protein FK531_13495 [Rhodococcus spelaei]|uniref:Integral membrane protein n=1 Tax=Rhodococcus spelaei TaxID=2546320 RepID=A0A541B934_9NOCA|nr:hypothetical protein [Rhodococcus spelaei]TQF68803.1 hypothetical protein FK531_13495 [Rhodococcus spelaei]